MDLGDFLFCLLSCGNAVQALFSYDRCGAFLHLFVLTSHVCSGEVTLYVRARARARTLFLDRWVLLALLFRHVLTTKYIGCYPIQNLSAILCYLVRFAPPPPGSVSAGVFFLFYLLILYQNLYTGVRPLDIGTVKE